MKANDIQKRIIDICIDNLSTWSCNNDIDSPSNICELEADFDALEDNCGVNFDDVKARMYDLWKTIRKQGNKRN